VGEVRSQAWSSLVKPGRPKSESEFFIYVFRISKSHALDRIKLRRDGGYESQWRAAFATLRRAKVMSDRGGAESRDSDFWICNFFGESISIKAVLRFCGLMRFNAVYGDCTS
jgi:hypothetical protein